MKDFIRKYVSELEKGNIEYTLKVYDENAIIHLPSNLGVIDRNQAMEYARSFIELFPDLTHKIELLIEEGDTVVMRSMNKATHKKEFMGIKATGKTVQFEELMIFRIKNSKIIETWGMVDVTSLKYQLEN